MRVRTENLKPRQLPAIAAMTPEQRDTLEAWLFDENITYAVAIERVQSQFGLKISPTTLVKFYRQMAQKRNLNRILQSATHANAVMETLKKNPADTYRALVGVAGQFAFEAAIDPKNPLNARGFQELIELCNTGRADLRAEEKLALDHEKWEFDATEACMKKLPELKVISTNPAIPYQEKIRQIRLKLFGSAT
jgi:hypothetical protein